MTGWLFAKWRTPAAEARCDLELMLLANHVRYSSSDVIVVASGLLVAYQKLRCVRLPAVGLYDDGPEAGPD